MIVRLSEMQLICVSKSNLHTKNLTPTALATSTKFFPCSISPDTFAGKIDGSKKLVTYSSKDNQTARSRGIQIQSTPNTPSLPVMAFLSDSLSQRSALTTSTPLAMSFFDASESGLRLIARGVKVPSSKRALMTEEPA